MSAEVEMTPKTIAEDKHREPKTGVRTDDYDYDSQDGSLRGSLNRVGSNPV